MSCDECKNLIGFFMDNELDEIQASSVRSHLSVCTNCVRVCEDLTSILDVCNSGSPSDLAPPNPKALWCRINNVIESEVKTDSSVTVDKPQRFFWQLSFGQLSAVVISIAVISSLLTVIGIKNYLQPPVPDLSARSNAVQSPFETMMSKLGLTETPQGTRDRRLREQKAAIQYWDTRVQARRSQWDHATRDAFDRNLQVIDESVNDYTMILQRDPEDELSGEMLDSVLNDKMNLLRDFSDL